MTAEALNLALSILAADFSHLGHQVAEAERAGLDRIHVDVMEGHFMPGLSMGPPIISSLGRVTHLPLATHLTNSYPDFFIGEFAQARAGSFLKRSAPVIDVASARRTVKLHPGA